MKNIFNNKKGLTYMLVRWAIKFWYPNMSNPAKAVYDLRRFLEMIHKYSLNNGYVMTIKRLKNLRLLVTRYLSGEPLMVLPNSGIAVDKYGYPKCINYTKEFADSSNLDDKRYLLTLINISRSFKVQGTLDLSSITDPFKGTQQTLDNQTLDRIITDFGLKITDPLGRPGLDRKAITPYGAFRLTTKAGPSGHAFSTSMLNMVQLTDSMKAAIGCLIGDKFVQFISDSSNLLPKKMIEGFGHVKYQSLRRLSVINDPELKCRVIAIVDYWTQTALRPLHKEIFKLLRNNFPQDRTFTQAPYISKVAGQKFHSLDLTAATDRIPAVLQRDILQLMTDKNTAFSWYELMVKHPFLIPGSHTEYVKYSVGQPMGALSS